MELFEKLKLEMGSEQVWMDVSPEGEILRYLLESINGQIPAGCIPISQEQWQRQLSQGATHYRNGVALIEKSTADLELEQQLRINSRNRELTATDKYMLIDFPITESQREEAKVYRQGLRDLPETGIMPTKPDWMK